MGNQTTHVHPLSVVASSFYPGINSELNCLLGLPLQVTLSALQTVGLHTSGTFLNLTFAINAELMHWARHAQLIRLTLMKNVFGMTPLPSVTLQRKFLFCCLCIDDQISFAAWHWWSDGAFIKLQLVLCYLFQLCDFVRNLRYWVGKWKCSLTPCPSLYGSKLYLRLSKYFHFPQSVICFANLFFLLRRRRSQMISFGWGMEWLTLIELTPLRGSLEQANKYFTLPWVSKASLFFFFVSLQSFRFSLSEHVNL